MYRTTKLLYIIFSFLVLSTNVPGGQSRRSGSDRVESPERLSTKDKAHLQQILLLKQMNGNQVWPRFSDTLIPLILFNEGFEFLILCSDPPAPWIPVENDRFLGQVYYRRKAADPQAFAVRVDQIWAGSLNTLDHMSRTMMSEVKEKIPPEKLTPAMLKMFEVTPGQHASALLHETFHAFQALSSPLRFKAANDSYVLKTKYPYQDEAFNASWNKEGEILKDAVRAKDDSARLLKVREFVQARYKRRSDFPLTQDLIEFECKLEWLEGLGKYAEMQFCNYGTSLPDSEAANSFRITSNRLRADFFFRLAKLGNQHGDLRFYLSGYAQALILDLLDPGWKEKITGNVNIGLEDLLEQAALR